jgi:hypothetical protein
MPARPEVTGRALLVGEPSKTINEFCAHERISRAQYYALRKLGKAPVELRIEGVIRITPQAHARWRRKYTKPLQRPRSGASANAAAS